MSDLGFDGLVVLNRARQVRFDIMHEPPTVWAASGANLGLVARQAATRGLSGLEWAAGIPGSVGGAVVGNAGAHGDDMAGHLLMAKILHRRESVSDLKNGKDKTIELIQEEWPVESLEYSYRNSSIKRLQRAPISGTTASQPQAIVLDARLRLSRSSEALILKRMEENALFRRSTQPPGASMGSMFKKAIFLT